MKTTEFYTTINAHKFFKRLNKHIPCEILSSEYLLKTFYDSFDWRLYQNNLLAELVRSKNNTFFNLSRLDSHELLTTIKLKDVPKFVDQFEQPQLINLIKPCLENRALISIANIDYENYTLGLYNKKSELLLELRFEQYELINNRIIILSDDNQDKQLKAILKTLNQEFNLLSSKDTVLSKVLKAQGRKPMDYSAKFKIELDPEQPAYLACLLIYKQLLKIIRINEQGIINNIDDEFLHDYRVAIHKTQVGLKQFKSVFVQETIDYFLGFFNQLAHKTNASRDITIQLDHFYQLQSQLNQEDQTNLNDYHQYLLDKQTANHLDLVALLSSAEYLTMLHEWALFLKQTAVDSKLLQAQLNVKQLANTRISKTYQHLIEQTQQIKTLNDESQFHQVRKSCKKLRYLLEFFQDLYPTKKIKPLIKILKNLQTILGEHQDLQVQLAELDLYKQQLNLNQTTPTDLTAIEHLISQIQANYPRIESAFFAAFAELTTPNSKKLVGYLAKKSACHD